MADGAQDPRALDQAGLAAIYMANFAAFVRLAALLVDDVSEAESVVQETYLRVAAALPRLHDPDNVLPYLRRSVINRSRSTLRRRLMATSRGVTDRTDLVDGADESVAAFERQEIVLALRKLPRRRREAVVLRYFVDLDFAEIGRLLGVSESSARSYCTRALAQLATLIEEPE